MQSQTRGPLAQFANRFWSYLPTLAAGLFVLALGVFLGWVAKRAVIRVLIWLRLDRLGGRRGWRAAFEKGDVRAALYNLVGNVAMVVVILIFLDSAFQIWGLTVLTRLMDRTVFYLPNLALVAFILAVGVALANSMSTRMEQVLREEGLERPRLISEAFRAILLAFVGALALWQLSFAREIVLGAFLIAFGAVGIGFALAAGIGGARAVQSGLEDLFQKRKEKEEE